MTLSESILATIAYYNLFSYPLTELELWSYAFRHKGCDDFVSMVNELETLRASGRLRLMNGMYYLPGREGVIAMRHERYVIAERKYSRAVWFARMIARFPFVRMIAVCNTLAFSNAVDESDIDLFIVVRHGWIWCARAFTAGLAHLLRLRPGQRGTLRDSICLSFFVTDTALSLAPFVLKEKDGVEDIHLAAWVRNFVPLYDEENIFQDFVRANAWADRSYMRVVSWRSNDRRSVRNSLLARAGKKACEVVMQFVHTPLEYCARSAQMAVMPKGIQAAAQSGTNVVLTDSVLKFHLTDRREEIRERYKDAIREVLRSS